MVRSRRPTGREVSSDLSRVRASSIVERMDSLALAAPSGLAPASDGGDRQLVALWLSLKTSRHTRRAYASEAARFLAFVQKPLASVTLTDLQAWTENLGQGSLLPASQNRALTALKSLLSFAQETRSEEHTSELQS